MTKRLFIAIKIDPTEELFRRINFLKRNLEEENINWIREDHLHITLRFLGNTPERKIAGLVSSVEKSLSQFEPFELSLEGLSFFGSRYSPKVIWAGVEPKQNLENIFNEINKAIAVFGFKVDRQNFVPHLSIARIRKLKEKAFFHQVIEKADLSQIQKQQINTIILYESILHPRGAEYKIVKKFQLQ